MHIFKRNKSDGEDAFKVYELIVWSRELIENLEKTLVHLDTVAALSTTSQFDEVKFAKN